MGCGSVDGQYLPSAMKKVNLSFILVLFLMLLVVSWMIISTSNNKNEKDSKRNNERHIHTQGCEVVHICFVVENEFAVNTVVASMKMILFHRYSRLHFHLISDQTSRDILETLLSTWKLPYVESTYYSIITTRTVIASVFANVQNMRFYDEFGLMKLVLPYILLSNVEKVIVLDNNSVVFADLKDLWDYFEDVRKNSRLFALARKTEDCTQGTVGCYSSKVMLFDLLAMRHRNWYGIVQQSARTAAPADQHSMTRSPVSLDKLINTVIDNNSSLHSTLPCVWNVDVERPNRCEGGIPLSEYKLFQLASGVVNITNHFMQHIINKRNAVMSSNGELLLYSPIRCGNFNRFVPPSPLPPQNMSGICNTLKQQSEMPFRTHKFYYGTKYFPESDNDVTLSTQLSLDRLRELHLLIENWDGPLSIAMYGIDKDAIKLLDFLNSLGIRENRSNVAIHIVYQRGFLYPINYLRNVALDAVSTPYVFLSDGDVLPKPNLYQQLKQEPTLRLLNSEHFALVIPDFETKEYNSEVPPNKKELIEQIESDLVTIGCPFCKTKRNSQTRYKKWMKADEPYRVQWGMFYQPYLVVRRTIVRYNTMFMEYGLNKAAHVMEMYAQGYRFVVLDKLFVIHTPHPSSEAKEVWRSKYFQDCLQNVWKEFKRDLFESYGVMLS